MQYAAWIQSDHAWGGAIELVIFAQYLRVTFSTYDVRSQRLVSYTEDGDFDTVGFLLYDGIHYNYVACCVGGSLDVTQLDSTDSLVEQKVVALDCDLLEKK